MLNKIKKTGCKGYTLIELLVGIFIFMILIGASVGFFVSSLRMQQKALFSQRLLDNVSYTMEYMGRALRMSQKDVTAKCIAANQNYATTTTGYGGIKILNYRGECWEFYLNSTPNSSNAHVLMVTVNGKTSSMTSEFLDVTSFKIMPKGWTPSDSSQPEVTLFLQAKMIKDKRVNLQPTIKIQTTVSQRNLDL